MSTPALQHPEATPSTSGTRASRGLRVAWALLGVVLGAIAWLLLLRFPARPVTALLDDSWNSLLAFDLRTGVQSGVDSIFTYGPLAYLFSPHPPFDPHLHTARLLTEFVGKAVLAITLLLPLRRFDHRWQQVCYAGLLLLVAPAMQDSCWLLAICLLTRGGIDPRPGQGLRMAIAVAVAAVLAAAKFTLFALGVFGLGAMLLPLLARRAYRQAALLLLGQALAFAAVWVAAGQQLGNIPAFVRASLEITSGYSQAMALQGPWLPIAAGAVVLLALAMSGVAAVARRPISLPDLAITAMAAATMFLAWKAAFVRQDEGHVMVLLTATMLAPILLPRAAGRGRRRLQAAAAILVVLASIAGYCVTISGSPTGYFAQWRTNAHRNLDWLIAPQAQREQLEQRTQQMRLDKALPAVRARVGNDSIDLMSFEQGTLFLNDLHVVHRPVIQGYSVYTPYLQQVNADFYASARAPRYVLVAVQPIDGHFPTSEDSGAWRALLHHYRPVLTESHYVLLCRRSGERQGLPEPSATVAGTARFDDWVEIPAEGSLYELELDVPMSLLGRLRTFALRPPSIFLEIRTRRGEKLGYRIAPCMVAAPFVLDPLVQNRMELLRAYLGRGERVAAFRLHSWASGSHWLASEFGYRLRRNDALLPDPTTFDAETSLGLATAAWPMFSPPPALTEPLLPWAGHRDAGEPVMLAEAPTRIAFDLPAGKHTVRASYGILTVAYTGNGQSNGVTFKVAFEPTEGTRTELFTRHLDPRTLPADRSRQTIELPLPEHEAGRLWLETDPGPDRDNRWDFSFWGPTTIAATSR